MHVFHFSHHVRRAAIGAVGIAVLCTMVPGPASAQTRNRRSTVTFSAPVEIPGVGAQVLPAGTYVFTVLESLSDRNIIRIASADESRVHATILAIPNHRLRATDQTVITFAERAAGDPQAVRAWFYPGENWGQEFVYPKSKALELAKSVRQPVLYIPDEVAPAIVAPVMTMAEPPVVGLRTASVRAIQPTGEDVAVSTVVVTPPAGVVARLPQTASGLPLFALVGVLLLGAGLSVRRLWAR
jgi:LPXTG-motif cell wall-anchored protein